MQSVQKRLSNTSRAQATATGSHPQINGPVELDLGLLAQVVGGGDGASAGPVGGWKPQSTTQSGPVGGWVPKAIGGSSV